MKLRELRGAIRKPGNPSMILDLGNGVPMTLSFQKTPLLEELGRVFGDEGTAETGLSYDPGTNLLSVEGVVGMQSEGGTCDLQMADEDNLDAVREKVHALADEIESGDEDDLL